MIGDDGASDQWTAYCSTCRQDVPVSWPPPPRSVKHIDGLEGEPPMHVHPEVRPGAVFTALTEIDGSMASAVSRQAGLSPEQVEELAAPERADSFRTGDGEERLARRTQHIRLARAVLEATATDMSQEVEG